MCRVRQDHQRKVGEPVPLLHEIVNNVIADLTNEVAVDHADVGDVRRVDDHFAAVLNHPKFAGKPMILETPKGEDDKGTPYDTKNLRRLRRMLD